MPINPITRFKTWHAEARKAKAPLPDACALATADRFGRPSVRMVLLKHVDDRGVVFFTNKNSRKGREVQVNPYASVVFYWHKIHKQARVEGRIKQISALETDTYWSTRSRESNLSALASAQSSPINSRSDLQRTFRALKKKYKGKDVPRPPHWVGYRIYPDAMEFWIRGDHRLHHRERFTKKGVTWKKHLLQP